ncbi:phytanoyl-CoA dioxygenase family protein [Actinopolymorpha alba]|uniref:phytanoyl-CoA dioxygenase family protein n=1 Tax=Actinopolymorpha alba TaxID=533267 RepID=UPI0003A3E11D|nr:phytanoyl-CoA dioxygenase family protein [Actinopolymorpha alba]
MGTQTFPPLRAQERVLDAAPEALGQLRRTDPSNPVEELHRRLDEDGYLYLPGYLDPEEVRAARRDVFTRLVEEGMVAPGTDPDDGIPGPTASNRVLDDVAKASGPLQRLLYAGRMVALYERLFGELVRHFDYTWLRAVRPGPGTEPHGDSVFMNRGTPRLLTAWVPLGDVDLRHGGLMVLERSHRLEDVRRDYHSRDVDTYCEGDPEAAAQARTGRWGWNGVISPDPVRLREELGLRWLTSEFSAGDVVTFPMYTLHGSLDNTSDRLRLSCDLRYQRASEPADPRWIGLEPTGHGAASKVGLIC